MNKNKTIYLTKYFKSEAQYMLFGRKIGILIWVGLIYTLSLIA